MTEPINGTQTPNPRDRNRPVTVPHGPITPRASERVNVEDYFSTNGIQDMWDLRGRFNNFLARRRLESFSNVSFAEGQFLNFPQYVQVLFEAYVDGEGRGFEEVLTSYLDKIQSAGEARTASLGDVVRDLNGGNNGYIGSIASRLKDNNGENFLSKIRREITETTAELSVDYSVMKSFISSVIGSLTPEERKDLKLPENFDIMDESISAKQLGDALATLIGGIEDSRKAVNTALSRSNDKIVTLSNNKEATFSNLLGLVAALPETVTEVAGNGNSFDINGELGFANNAPETKLPIASNSSQFSQGLNEILKIIGDGQSPNSGQVSNLLSQQGKDLMNRINGKVKDVVDNIDEINSNLEPNTNVEPWDFIGRREAALGRLYTEMETGGNEELIALYAMQALIFDRAEKIGARLGLGENHGTRFSSVEKAQGIINEAKYGGATNYLLFEHIARIEQGFNEAAIQAADETGFKEATAAVFDKAIGDSLNVGDTLSAISDLSLFDGKVAMFNIELNNRTTQAVHRIGKGQLTGQAPQVPADGAPTNGQVAGPNTVAQAIALTRPIMKTITDSVRGNVDAVAKVGKGILEANANYVKPIPTA